jgi:hypothetical protein
MPAKNTTGEITAAGVEASLPKGFFVRRGDIVKAFNLSDEEMTACVPDPFKPTYLPPNKRRKVKRSRAVFVRAQVVAVARRWEALS